MRNLLVMSLAVALLALAPPAQARTETRFTLDGRFYVVHTPARPRWAPHPTTAVVYLHSMGHDWREGAAIGWSAQADRAGFLAVYPDGRGSWNAGLCCGGAVRASRDDVAWLARVVQAVKLWYRLQRVYLVGYSNGGMMAERLVAERPWLATRIAVAAGAPEMPAPGRWAGRAYLWHGAFDTTVPWQGGAILLDGQLATIRPSPSTGVYLVVAYVSATVHPTLGHALPADWPSLAWDRLNGP
jgi:polyhydroxybutyrate depolymerase